MFRRNSGSREKDAGGTPRDTRPGAVGTRGAVRPDAEETVPGLLSSDTPIDLTTQQTLPGNNLDPEQTRYLNHPAIRSDDIETGVTRLDIPAGAPADDAPEGRPSSSSSELTGTGVGVVVPGGPDEGPLAPGHAFGSRYQIISVIGVGGMGAVYKAWDQELAVLVALKVIRPEVAADPKTARALEKRFKQELLLARQVTHRNVVRIHDLGEVSGIKYITMPLIEGEDLAAILKREGSLPVSRVMPIARTMVSGLAAAHKAGIVHRDLKPANIMVDTHGEALIMDFGVARSAARVTGRAARPTGVPGPMHMTELDSRTVVGSVVGTIDYMAPEQARAQSVDQRADIYAVGLILYDLLLGRKRSEHAESAILELQLRMQNPPPPPRSVDPSIPAPLDALITRCLQPDPAARFQTTEELEAALNRLNDQGKPLPVMRRLTRGMMAAVAVATVLLVVGAFFTAKWLMTPVKPHDPVSVVIADFQNNTGDPTFNQTLESTLRLGLEGASFINAYDRSKIRSTFGVRPAEKWDAAAARQLALKQGLGVVLAGAVTLKDSGYEISVKATEPYSDNVISDVTGIASSKDQVLETTTKLVTKVRKALGDKTSDSAQLFAMKTLSTTSLDVVKEYTAGVDAQNRANYEGAAQNFARAVKLDPTFGLGYQGLAAVSMNSGRPQEAIAYNKEALRHLDTVTERERYVIRAYYYVTTGDYQQCVKEYGELISRNPGNAIGFNNRANCLSKLRNMSGAVADVRQALQVLPRVPMYRGNLVVYSDYAGDFAGAEQAARQMEEPTDLSTLGLAFAQLGQGRLADATSTYQKLATINARGASRAASGLADLAMYEGHFSEAARLFEQGAAADLAAKNPERAARKLTSAGYARLFRGDTAAAVTAADKALALSTSVASRFLAGRIFAQANELTKARALASALSAELPAEPQAYGKIIEGEVALKSGDARQAVRILTDANGVLDTWFGHFDLGRAYLELKAFPEADSEFDRCIKRRGEALSLLVDEEVTYGQFPAVYYYQGRVREGLNSTSFGDSYREYMNIRGQSAEDPLRAEVSKRISR